jgi:hypothetical protein
MNFKQFIVGVIAFHAVIFVVSLATGPLIRQGVLENLYRDNSQFWRSELNEDHLDLAALMPQWTAPGVMMSVILVSLYPAVRPALKEPG